MADGHEGVSQPGYSDVEYQDVNCSFCDRHNRDVHMVAGRDGLTICQVCIAKCGEILDDDAGALGPEIDWAARWPTKTPLAAQ
jgi:hypothetical protein